MNILRKLTAVVTALSVVLSCSLVGFAEADDVWNRNYLAEGDEVLYEEFPMQLDKTVDSDMNLSVSMQYMKTIAEGDTVTVTVKEQESGSVIAEESLSAEHLWMNLENLANDTRYTVLVNETLAGVTNAYGGVISTQYITPDFPVDLTVGGTVIESGAEQTFPYLMVREVGQEITCNHPDDQPCTEECDQRTDIIKIAPEELDTFYGALAPDKYYMLQVDTKKGFDGIYSGFISTFADGGELGVFTRGYAFYPAEPDELAAFSEPLEMEPFATYSYDPAELRLYTSYENEYGKLITSSDHYLIDWTVPEEGTYTIETIGNVDTWIRSLNPSTLAVIKSYRDGGAGGNVSQKMVFAGSGERFVFSLEKERGTGGRFGFRIIRNDYENDDHTNYLDVAQNDADAGRFETEHEQFNNYIEYSGDVDVFTYKVGKGIGTVDFFNVDKELSVTFYEVVGRTDGIDDLSAITPPLTISPRSNSENFITFAANNEVVYIVVKQASIIPTADVYARYDMDFYEPKLKDPYEEAAHPKYGNTLVTPTPITFDSDYNCTIENATLHAGDSDSYSFVAGPEGGDLVVTLGTAGKYLYKLEMLDEVECNVTIDSVDPPSVSYSTTVGSLTSTDADRVLTLENLVPGRRYYIMVKRNGSNYSSKEKYHLECQIVLPQPNAALSGSVALSHEKGAGITSLDSFLDSVMAKLTCKVGDTVVSSAQARADVKLYYNNAELTPSIVSGLAAGTYAITAKFRGAVATGGSITLTVTEAASDVVELSGIPSGPVNVPEWDFLYCAKLMADYRLTGEGKPKSTLSVDDVAEKMGLDIDLPSRQGRSKALAATFWFYTNGVKGTGTEFEGGTNALSVTEELLYDKVNNGQAVIMWMVDPTQKADYDVSRYILISGVDKGNHKIKAYFPELGTNVWYSTDAIINGGFDSRNANLKFSGYIIEVN